MTVSMYDRVGRLKAFCKYGIHDDYIGHFYSRDDYIELPNGAGTSPDSWLRLTRSRGFLRGMVWRCEKCGKDTQHVPKGLSWVS